VHLQLHFVHFLYISTTSCLASSSNISVETYRHISANHTGQKRTPEWYTFKAKCPSKHPNKSVVNRNKQYDN